MQFIAGHLLPGWLVKTLFIGLSEGIRWLTPPKAIKLLRKTAIPSLDKKWAYVELIIAFSHTGPPDVEVHITCQTPTPTHWHAGRFMYRCTSLDKCKGSTDTICPEHNLPPLPSHILKHAFSSTISHATAFSLRCRYGSCFYFVFGSFVLMLLQFFCHAVCVLHDCKYV